MKAFINKIRAIWALLVSDEYFLTVANQKNPYGDPLLGPIIYEYMNNTDRELFYIFVNDYIKNHKINHD